MGKMKNRLLKKIENSTYMTSIRAGIIQTIPVVILGSLTLILQTFIGSLDSSSKVLEVIMDILSIVYQSTFGIMSVITTVLISVKCLETKKENVNIYVGIIIALTCFFILSGGITNSISAEAFGVEGMFTSIISSVMGTAIYSGISDFFKEKSIMLHGGYPEIQDIVNGILPVVCTVMIFAFFNEFISYITAADSFNDLFILIIGKLADHIGRNLLSGILFIFLSSVFWLLGIHGTDVLEPLTKELFVPAMDINEALAAAGEAPTEILSKTMFDVFVFMGGCGALISLLIGIFIFSRGKINRRLAKIAAPSMVFNVNEIMVFGIPIVMNPIFFIPFILTPIVCFLTSWTAMTLGIVPIPVNEVEWITPVILNGYLATGSWTGGMLQAVNIVIGIFIYRPFIKMYDTAQQKNAVTQIEKVTKVMKEAESTGKEVFLLERKDDIGYAAKNLEADIIHYVKNGKTDMYYQPQYDEKDNCIGFEALLRFKTELYGVIYPPLVIELMRESGRLCELEKYVFTYVANDMEKIYNAVGYKVKVSVNITPENLLNKEFVDFLVELSHRFDHNHGDICIEVTEQTHFEVTEQVEKVFEKLRRQGYLFAIDDFSMGSTSVKYLKKNLFDIVKLDGNLVKNVDGRDNEREIVSSIIILAKSLGIKVIAEYVENRKIQKQMEELGCTLYQGYFYSPAVAVDKLEYTVNEIKERLKPD